MTRNEWVIGLFSRRQGRGPVASGQVDLPSIPMTEIGEGNSGPEKEGRTEKVAPVSIKKEIILPATWSFTRGSARVMGVVEPGHLQSASPSMASGGS